MKQKLLVEAIVMIFFIIISIMILKFGPRIMGAQIEREEDANLKRLFGPAWRAAKDL